MNGKYRVYGQELKHKYSKKHRAERCFLLIEITGRVERRFLFLFCPNGYRLSGAVQRGLAAHLIGPYSERIGGL